MVVVTGSFKITLVRNGITINGNPVVINGPLLQYYDASGTITPDWSKAAADKQPVLYPYVLHGANVVVPTPASVKWTYNGITLTFDTSGNCTTNGYTNIFKAVTQTIASGKTTPALKIIGNLASGNNTDDDLIACTGSIEVNKSQISFGEVRFPVTVQTGSGTIYKVFISSDDFVVGEKKNAILKADVYINAQLQDATNFTFAYQQQDTNAADGWKDIVSTGQTCTITPDMVDSSTVIKCVARDKSGKIVGSDMVKITDSSDPYDIQYKGSDTVEDTDETVSFKVIKKTTGEDVSNRIQSITWRFTDNGGNNIETPTVSNDKRSVTFSPKVLENADDNIWMYTTVKIED